jgi:CHAT domain-containing protein/Tfp pilus assembly protein PilF
MRSRLLSSSVYALLAAATTLVAARPQDVPQHDHNDLTEFDPTATIERHIERHQEHRYQLALAAGECVHLTVEQRGIDVVAQTFDASGTRLGEFRENVFPRGAEQVEIVGDRAGPYTVLVKIAEGVPIAPDSTYAIRVVSRAPATDADRAIQQARALYADAYPLNHDGKYDQERPLLERALRLAEAARGPDDRFVTAIVFELATNALARLDDKAAEALYQRAIGSMIKAWGHDHPAVAMARSRLAVIWDHAGQRAKAETLLLESMDQIEKTVGPEHLWYARCLMTLGNFRSLGGDLDKAEEYYRRVMAILEKNEYTETLLFGTLLNNLGDTYRQKENLAVAEAYFERAYALEVRLHGSSSYPLTIVLQNLGIVARERKEYAKSIEYYQRSLAMRERAVGREHPDYAQVLMNLANVYHAMGDDAKAIETYFDALEIWEKTVGPYHRGMLLTIGNIARTYVSAGDIANGIKFQQRTDEIIEKQIELNLTAGSERQKLAFVSSMAERTDRTISLHLLEAPNNPEAGALAALVLLQRKGRVLDAMTDTFATVRQRVSDAKDQQLLDQLSSTTAQLARAALTVPEHVSPNEHQQRLATLTDRMERLEGTLSGDIAEFRARTQPVTLEAVQAAIPDGAALVEFFVFRPFHPKAERNAEAYDAPHYAAYVIRKRAAPVGVDLGAVAQIDEAVETLRQALRDPTRRDLRQRARAVDDRIVRPLRASLGSATTRLLISPDGDLNLLPFEALIDERGRFLVEQYAISYVTSGRDLLRMQVTRANQSPPAIVANPLFGAPSMSPSATVASAARPSRRSSSITTADDLSAMYFAPLGATAMEARAIKALFPESTLLTGRRATKATLQQLQAPRLLHIASHGFFLEDASVKVDNPLLRSGLALAGANTNRNTDALHDDGILTALEASSLNLWGTKLVTLSACDTGVGEVRNGEGVYGLRRAFVLAGAETLVMSLWPVSDYVTREIMTKYYTGLRAGLGRGDALRQAQLAMLRRKGRRHPFYWASFIQSGEWANLDGVR